MQAEAANAEASSALEAATAEAAGELAGQVCFGAVFCSCDGWAFLLAAWRHGSSTVPAAVE
jgi:hypothetical protein